LKFNVQKTLVIDYMPMVIDYYFVKTVIKLFGLLVIDYCLMVIDYQRVKTLVKDFSLKNSFGQIVLFNLFFEKIFLYLS